MSRRPIVIAVGGFTSEVGKTSLLCDLLPAFPGWEAIKTTRGHYRSCGKDPHACCVSHLLEDKAVIRSGKQLTYAPGKDTGRYWDAGAVNVHWLIATDEQVADGIRDAIDRVEAKGVFIEGNSFTEFIKPDFFIMVARTDDLKIKSTARRALRRVSAFYISGEIEGDGRERMKEILPKLAADFDNKVPVFTRNELRQLVIQMQEIETSAAQNCRQTFRVTDAP